MGGRSGRNWPFATVNNRQGRGLAFRYEIILRPPGKKAYGLLCAALRRVPSGTASVAKVSAMQLLVTA